MHTKSKNKMSHKTREFHSIILQEDLTRVDEEDLAEVEDVEDLLEEAKNRSFVIIEIK